MVSDETRKIQEALDVFRPLCHLCLLRGIGAKTHLKPPSLKYPQADAGYAAVMAFPLPLAITTFLLLSISLSPPSCYEGHQAPGDVVPQEGGELESPSLLLFFHNLLFMSDRPPPDKWLPYGERERLKKGKKGKTLSTSLRSPWPSENLRGLWFFLLQISYNVRHTT